MCSEFSHKVFDYGVNDYLSIYFLCIIYVSVNTSVNNDDLLLNWISIKCNECYDCQIATGTISQQQGLQDKGYEEWAGEMIGMREVLKKFANVSRSEIVGARAPFLKPGRNTQFKVSGLRNSSIARHGKLVGHMHRLKPIWYFVYWRYFY